MSLNHEAVYALYPNVVSIDGDQPYDAEGNTVDITLSEVNAWVPPDQYARDRKAAYLPITDQLDMMYWDKVNGTSNWQEHVSEVKTLHPKPE